MSEIKALEWEAVEPVGGWTWMTIAQAETPFGRYTLDRHDKGCFLRVLFGNQRIGHFDDDRRDEAEKAAQSDFDARIRSALVERKAEPGDGVRDAAARHCGLVRAAHGGPFRKLPDIFDAFIAGANWRADAALSASPSPVDSRDGLIEQLVKALEPFAQAASVLRTVERTTGREFKDEDAFQSGLAWNNDGIVTTITYGHLRAAHLALAAKEQQP